MVVKFAAHLDNKRLGGLAGLLSGLAALEMGPRLSPALSHCVYGGGGVGSG